MLRRAGLYWHTLRHLKRSQLGWQLRYRVTKPKMPADGLPPAERARVDAEAWVPPAARPNTLHEGWRFTHLQVEADWDAAVSDPDARELLWQYRFHEFEDLVAADASARRALHADWIARWIAAFPPLAKAAWDPYPVSMRVGNWVRWALSGGTLDDAARASMARQLRHLEKRLEFHLRGNHLMENAKALYLGGSFLAGAEADRWRARGRTLLREQVAEQVLADGGHCERSPMYHGLMLEALQDCASVARVYGDAALADELTPTIRKMDRWLRAMTHPDGGIAFFQDACHGVALPPADLHARSAALEAVDPTPLRPVLRLQDSGYFRLQQGDALLLMDAGAPGPSWQPGHAHAGTLSVELSIGEQRVFVNTGTSCYGTSPERLRQRGTLAHNTVCLDGEDSSEVWGGFRVARRAHVVRENTSETDDGEAIYCFADLEGYAGGRGKTAWLHREVHLSERGHRIEIRDLRPSRDAVVSWHLHPDVECPGPAGLAAEDGGVSLRVGGRDCRLRVLWSRLGGELADAEDLTARLRVEPSVYAPGFGVTRPSQVLRLAVPREVPVGAVLTTVLTRR